jgi:hypothetical protein
MPATWYVTFEVRRSGVLSSRRRGPRSTRTFETETEAKIFARTKFHEGLIVYAGTINPHSPKRLISSRNLPHWLEEPQQQPSEDRNGTAGEEE